MIQVISPISLYASKALDDRTPQTHFEGWRMVGWRWDGKGGIVMPISSYFWQLCAFSPQVFIPSMTLLLGVSATKVRGYKQAHQRTDEVAAEKRGRETDMWSGYSEEGGGGSWLPTLARAAGASWQRKRRTLTTISSQRSDFSGLHTTTETFETIHFQLRLRQSELLWGN